MYNGMYKLCHLENGDPYLRRLPPLSELHDSVKHWENILEKISDIEINKEYKQEVIDSLCIECIKKINVNKHYIDNYEKYRAEFEN